MDKKTLKLAIDALKKGGLVVFPTDTVYGLLVDAQNESAVEKLVAFKERPKGKPISVFVNGFDMIGDVTELTPKESDRLREILPGAFTVVLKSKHKVSPLLESEKGTLGVRLTKSEEVNRLMQAYGKPVTATSANKSGHPPVHSIQALMNQLNEKQRKMIDLIVDIGELPRNKPSTVIDMTTDDVKVLREGDIRFSSIKQFGSHSEDDTIKIGKHIMKELIKDESRPICIILQGDLGSGKTQFVKGAAQALKVKESIISPTFVIYYEYKIPGGAFNYLIHMDLYNVKDAEEFRYLGMDKYLKEPNIFCIEWGEKSGEIMDSLQKRARIIYIHIKHAGETEREISVRS